MVKNKTIFHGLYSYRPKKWRQSVKTLQWNHYMYLRLPFPVRGREVSHLLGWSPSICTKYTVTLIFKGSSILPRNSAPCSCSFCIANCIYRRFLITQFLEIKLWARIQLQIRDKSSPLFLYLYVSLIWPTVCAASSVVTIDFKLADIKLESSEAYLLKLEKNL